VFWCGHIELRPSSQSRLNMVVISSPLTFELCFLIPRHGRSPSLTSSSFSLPLDNQTPLQPLFSLAEYVSICVRNSHGTSPQSYVPHPAAQSICTHVLWSAALGESLLPIMFCVTSTDLPALSFVTRESGRPCISALVSTRSSGLIQPPLGTCNCSRSALIWRSILPSVTSSTRSSR
jgi:hypothetical protein